MEYEVVSHQHLPDIRVFVVEIFTRTAHAHREYELCLLLRGGLQVDCEGRSTMLQPGELVLFSPRQAHALRALEGGALLLILQASPQFCADYFPQAAQVRFDLQTALPEQSQLREGLLTLGHCCFTRPVGYEFSAMAEVNRLFALLFSRAPWHTVVQQMDRGATRVARVCARIEADYAEPLRLHELAATEGVSADYLSHAFRKHLGMSFQDYLSQIRLEHAVTLVEKTDMTITDICTACGYSNPRYLTADFRNRLGCTPSEYRAGLPARPSHNESGRSSDTQQRFYSNTEALSALEDWQK